MNDNNTFHYTYSAVQNREVQSIRQKYLPREENRLELLRRLDNRVSTAGTAESLVAGVLGCLVFGTGLCFIFQVIGHSVIPGIFLCLLGTAAMAAAYPVCRSLRNKARAELTPKILALTEEMMNG